MKPNDVPPWNMYRLNEPPWSIIQPISAASRAASVSWCGTPQPSNHPAQYSPDMSGSFGRKRWSLANAESASPGPKLTTARTSERVPRGSWLGPSAVKKSDGSKPAAR